MGSPLILLVDDAPEIGVIVRRFGRQANQVVSVEPSAEAGWNYLQTARQPDLAIVDVNLPGASGFDLCRCLRASPGLKHLPVALFSHWHRPQDVAAALTAGTNFLLSKDLLCQPDGWQRRVAEILQPPAGRHPEFFLRWLDGPLPELCRLAEQLAPALALAAGGWFDADVMRTLVGRAWCETRPALPADELHRLLAPPSWMLAPDRLAAQISPIELPLFLRAFVEQTWCLLGTADAAPFWAALAAVAPPDREDLPPP